jgi:ATP/maltotriose-dependent transcriptional regulator MalT
MTARVMPAPEASLLLNSWWTYCLPSNEKRDKPELNSSETASFNLPWQALAESLREGMMVISRNIKPLYLNQQAKVLCKILSEANQKVGLPQEISEICHKLIKNGNSSAQSIVMEFQGTDNQIIRVRASWLNPTVGEESNLQSRGQYILVLLENRNEILKEELQFEQKKYQLTEREMEIWTLLRQDFSYQEIAQTLHISLNTVKTHVKNIYAKKRWNQEQRKTLRD